MRRSSEILGRDDKDSVAGCLAPRYVDKVVGAGQKSPIAKRFPEKVRGLGLNLHGWVGCHISQYFRIVGSIETIKRIINRRLKRAPEKVCLGSTYTNVWLGHVLMIYGDDEDAVAARRLIQPAKGL